ncbi:MAG: hypothetical protein AB1631_04055 [Acidobacteriota bacterium]
MYKCEICGTVSAPRTPAHKVVIQTRRATYPFRQKVNACWKWKGDRRKFVHTDDPGGAGWECAREALVCATCAQRLKANGSALPRV